MTSQHYGQINEIECYFDVMMIFHHPGTNCETEINDCVTPAYPCSTMGTDTSFFDNGCRDTLEGFECKCRPGFMGADCGVRMMIPQICQINY